MRAVHVLEKSEAPIATATESNLLKFDPAEFREKFDRTPFLIEHDLVAHPLFHLPRILELARTLPEANVEYNAGNIPVSLRPDLTPRNGLSIEETIRRINDCKSWMVLKYVEHDPEYRALLHACLGEIMPYSEPLRPGMIQGQAFIFLTSPGSVTPYHMDPEHNFLLQVRGTKKIHLFNGRNPEVISETMLESFYQGAHRNLEFKEEFLENAWKFELRPGFGLHFPVTYPHFVENGAEVSISFSITFRTPDLEKRSMAHNVNAYLRGKGWNPNPVGLHPFRDRMKVQGFRLVRRLRKLFGRPSA